MEKKEKEELKDRFMNLVVDDKREKITVKDLTATAMMIRNSPPDYSVLLNFIEKELDKAREEVERKFIEKYYKRGEEMNVPYSEEDGKEFWEGYQEGYNQGLKDMIVDTYYLDKEFELKLKQ